MRTIPRLLDSLVPTICEIVETLCYEVLASELQNASKHIERRVQSLAQQHNSVSRATIRFRSPADQHDCDALTATLERIGGPEWTYEPVSWLESGTVEIEIDGQTISSCPLSRLENVLCELRIQREIDRSFYRDVVLRELIEYIK